ncbi:MAG: beta-lactamase family protein [Acidobacteria bacterium]|nr:beta-lactamase family protein [Acidobacteriota bacterium]
MRGAAVALLMAGMAAAQLRPAKPEAVGMSAARLESAAALLSSEVEQGRVLAASMIVARREKVVLHKGFGRLNPSAGDPTVSPDTIFLLASITKPVTACAMMLLVERGRVSLEEAVSHYLPEFNGQDRAKVRVRDLLSHTSGLPDMLPENIELRRAHAPLSEFVKHTFTTPLLYAPRTGFQYQSMGVLLAGEIVERVSDMRLRDFEKREIFDRLAMKHSALGMGPWKIEETAWCQSGPKANQEDLRSFGANSPYWRDMGHPWGGMHSTTGDLAILLQTFLNGGTYNGVRVFSPATVAAMTRDQNEAVQAPWGLGWGLAGSKVWAYFGDLVSPRTFGHCGATGTVAWADPERQLLCVILTTRPLDQDNGRLLKVVSNAVSAAVEKP